MFEREKIKSKKKNAHLYLIIQSLWICSDDAVRMLTGGIYNTSNALSRHCTADLNKDKDLAQKILNIALCFTDLQYFAFEIDLHYIALYCVALICNILQLNLICITMH